MGKETQASYAAGNSYMNALARYRIRIGEKAASIDLGITEEIGYLAKPPKELAKMKAPGNLILLSPEDLCFLGLPLRSIARGIVVSEMPNHRRHRNSRKYNRQRLPGTHLDDSTNVSTPLPDRQHEI